MTEEETNVDIEHEEKVEEISLEEELKAQKDKYLRLLAENENVRKRMQKEKTDMTRFGVENALAEFLSPLDSFEKALEVADKMSDEVKNWAIGFQMILGQLRGVLEERGIVPFTAAGERFDPYRHEAVETVETDEFPEDTVVEELLRGYLVGDRVLRAARVKVAKPLQKQGEQDDRETE